MSAPELGRIYKVNGDVVMLVQGRPSYLEWQGRDADGDHVSYYWKTSHDARPLVVIDPEDIVHPGQADDDNDRIPEIVNCLRRIAEADGGTNWRSRLCFRLANEFERHNQPPKPDEPNGLGAVVEDSNGRRFTRRCCCGAPQDWRPEHSIDGTRGGKAVAYAEIDVVRVLSEGVTDE